MSISANFFKVLSTALVALALVVPHQVFAMAGQLSIQEGALRVQRDDGFKVRFYKGSYTAKMDWNNRLFNLAVDRKDITTRIEIPIAAGLQLPANGSFSIPASKSGQTFNFSGTVETKISDSAPIREYEPCTYYQREWVCYYNGRYEECGWEDVAVQGSREVEFYYQTKTVNLSATLASPPEGQGQLKGREVRRNKIYNFQGQCY